MNYRELKNRQDILLSELPKTIQDDLIANGKLWHSNLGVVTFRVRVILAGKAWNLNAYIGDLDDIQEFTGWEDEDLEDNDGILEMLDQYHDMALENIFDCVDLEFRATESLSLYERGFTDIPTLFGVEPYRS